jgi:iron complex transport system substrate-binding protein
LRIADFGLRINNKKLIREWMTSTSAWRMLALVVFILGSFCAEGLSFPVMEKDDRNKEIVLSTRPLRIISLAPTNTELLFALGLDKEIVGVTQYCDYPEAARKKEKVGGFINFDLERIRALQPDLILAFGTMQLPVVEAMEKSGFRVFWIYPHTVDDILASFERVGRLTGAVQEARQLRAAVEREVIDLRKEFSALPESKRPTVLRVMSLNQPATIGAESFQTDLFRLAGGRNAFPAAGQDYFELDAQELIMGDPAVVLVCGNDEKSLKQKIKGSPLYGNLPAVKKDAVLVMPCELTCRPGPRIAETARRLARYLHGK